LFRRRISRANRIEILGVVNQSFGMLIVLIYIQMNVENFDELLFSYIALYRAVTIVVISHSKVVQRIKMVLIKERCIIPI
jgi:hypothetical protein